jgi:hypothetical protein
MIFLPIFCIVVPDLALNQDASPAALHAGRWRR